VTWLSGLLSGLAFGLLIFAVIQSYDLERRIQKLERDVGEKK